MSGYWLFSLTCETRMALVEERGRIRKEHLLNPEHALFTGSFPALDLSLH